MHPPRIPVDLDAVADLLFSTSEGGSVMARATREREPDMVRGQLLRVRNDPDLLFGDAPGR